VKLASVGDGVRLIPACDACHGERGAGNSGFYGMPALEGQKLQDLTVQLLAFRSGERGNDVYRAMRDVSKRLTDAEIAELASYYSGAPPDKSLVKPPQK
jgi:cytochrome c553